MLRGNLVMGHSHQAEAWNLHHRERIGHARLEPLVPVPHLPVERAGIESLSSKSGVLTGPKFPVLEKLPLKLKSCAASAA